MPDEETQAAPPKGGLPIKTLAAVAVVVIIEAVVIIGVFMLNSGPEQVAADELATDVVAMAEQPAELLVIAEKFQNTRTGRAYLYDTEVYIVCKSKFLGTLESRLETNRAQISSDLAFLFRRAEPSFLLEPDLSTLRRQIHAVLDSRLGKDEDSGKSYIDEVLIPKCTQFRSDG
ncbi:hypothetical protein [Mucisphaera calidilacus]|uniref:Flagellar protein FliL n=1 Tax=Mucisphaera calidilacus TaxID=2527982 RepID=A0A518BYW9_9BACT|nr:hypothetical protein [Mucisphaera calidilacus]QDU72165.1 hypothetical protein Pan265_20280 [Mucisphaera calidilacus]